LGGVGRNVLNGFILYKIRDNRFFESENSGVKRSIREHCIEKQSNSRWKKRTPISGFLGKKGHLFSTEDTCISEEDTDETSNNGRQ
jgi:hypothetical protein